MARKGKPVRSDPNPSPLRRRRWDSDESIAVVARRAGISPSTLGNTERGRQVWGPRESTALAIIAALFGPGTYDLADWRLYIPRTYESRKQQPLKGV
ncbi:MAG: helix-turn-helix transcriptional regulator [Candidatus Saccharimonadales bacterium]